MSMEEKNAYLSELKSFVYASPAGAVQQAKKTGFLTAIKSSARWNELFEREISASIANAPTEAQRIGLSSEGAAQSILDLMPQAARAPIAFLRPSVHYGMNGIAAGRGHTSSFILTGNYVIGTVENDEGDIVDELTARSVKYADPQLSHLILGGKKTVAAQADHVSCGSLAVSQQKELLKDNANQLYNDCLIISNAATSSNSNDPSRDIFLLSPESLRYSQSDLFVKIARAVVAGNDQVAEVVHKGQTYRVKTLVGLQQEGAKISSVDGRDVNLEEFRKRWLAKLDHVAIPKREAMQTGQEEDTKNLYLAHVVDRHARRVIGE